MFQPSTSSTLLVFTLGEHQESRRRQLLPKPHHGLERHLHRACIDATLAAGRSVGLKLEISTPTRFEVPEDVSLRRQEGRTFGARIRRAMAESFAAQNGAAQGGAVVLVGTDVPGLKSEHLQHSLRHLNENRDAVVVGPSPDGGIYLLAAARPLDEALAGVRWCCSGTLRSLKEMLRRAGRTIVVLPPLADLDRRKDLECWLAQHRRRDFQSWGRVLSDVLELFASLCRPDFRYDPRVTYSPLFAIPSLRGPPRSLA